MSKARRTTSKSFSEEQIEDLLELQRNTIREKIDYVEGKFENYPFLSLSLAFVLGFALGIALNPRSDK